ncbi:unnamed protein product, partial [marine sediment metagenome]
DSSEAMTGTAREKYGDDLELMVADARRLPFPNRSFDVVLLATSIEFIKDAESAAAEAERVARSELLFLMLNPDHPMNTMRMRRAESDGGVFRGARFRRPDELMKLFGGNGRRRWTGSLVIEPDSSPYYILKMIRENEDRQKA